jgi:hypothetical protein
MVPLRPRVRKTGEKKITREKYSDEKMKEDINLDSEDDKLSESSKYYHTSEVDDDDEGDDSNGDNGDQEEQEEEEEEDDHWGLDYSKWMDY